MVDRSSPFLLVANPRAGAGKARDRIPELAAALREAGGVFETALTNAPGHATQIVREALRDGVAGVAIVGGDGTLNEAINGFFDGGRRVAPDAWLGPLPCGTGGDFRRTLGIKKNVHAMATRMMWSVPRPVDVGRLSFRDDEGATRERMFLNIASFGIGGQVDRLVNEGPKWMGGTPAFLLGTLRAMATYRNQRIRIRVDDGPWRSTEIVNVAVANGRYFGGGMQIAPEASIDDGLFDVVGLEGLSARQQLELTPHLYRGTLLGREGVTHVRARRVEAEPDDWDGPVLLDVDGEAPGSLPATFTIEPGAVLLRA